MNTDEHGFEGKAGGGIKRAEGIDGFAAAVMGDYCEWYEIER